ncbi:MAG TPA: hypothetical protein VJ642_05860 [Chromobacteriaceae bacterium]|nr:hypothetical protein [Chromobacteriaceae bacterium]
MSDSPEKKSNFKKYLIAATVALSTPAAYLTGLSYYQGVLSAYGISSDAFPLATTDIYVQSYFAIGYIILAAGQFSSKILNWCFSTPGLYWISGATLLLITLTYAILKLNHKSRAILSRQNSKIEKILDYLNPKDNKFTKACALIFISSYAIYVIPTAILICAVSWWTLPVTAYQRGYDMEIEKVSTFRKLGCTKDNKTIWDKCFTVQDENGKIIHEGILVALSTKEIAIFEKSGSYIFTRKDSYTIKRKIH